MPIMDNNKSLIMDSFKKLEIWFLTGSQHLYGQKTLNKVADNAQHIVHYLKNNLPIQLIFKPVLKSSGEIYQLILDANYNTDCIGIIIWMHTFSPSKMWINGLKILQKPLCHLHTQFNRDIPWNDIDMDFMNLNQSAHGDREFGYILSRMKIPRKVIVGHWQNERVSSQLNDWTRAILGWHDLQNAKFVRFGDNMRQVAVTEGDKVEAQITFGFQVNTHGIGDLVSEIDQVKASEIDDLCEVYNQEYHLTSSLSRNGTHYNSLREAAKIELGLTNFLTKGQYKGFTTTFEDLHGLTQLPGISVQRLMKKGFGFGAEGDWKTAALLRAMKTMSIGLAGGNSFMEDYTYHFEPNNEMVLGAHMLEICPSIAQDKPSCEIHPLGIGGKSDPVRLVFNVRGGKALNASLIDLGHRFRLLVNEVEAVTPLHNLPKLPVARVLWKPQPDMETACAAWLLAGGAHHTVYSQNISTRTLQDFAEIAGIELALIHKEMGNLSQFKNELRQNEASY
jgi:L-arabinose isomerase